MSTVIATEIKRTGHFRSTQTVEMVRVSKRRDGTEDVIRAHMPVGLGWGDGTVLQWINKGWQSAADYDARKHSEEVQAKRDEESQKKYLVPQPEEKLDEKPKKAVK